MELTVLERANLLNILPKEGNFTTLKTVRKLRESLSLREDEVEKWRVQITEEGRMSWRVVDDGGNPVSQEAEVEITESGKDIVKAVLRRLDERDALKDDYFTLYEKFIGE